MGKRANCQNLILKVVGCQLLMGVMNGKGIWHEKREREKKRGGGNQSNYLPTFSKKKKKCHISLNVERSYAKIKGEQPP